MINDFVIDQLGQSATSQQAAFFFTSDHRRLTDAGWSYRTNNDRGWIIYRDCKTGEWYTRKKAIALMNVRVADNAQRH
jgi:hypothetical protein